MARVPGVKDRLKQHVMNATGEAIAPQLGEILTAMGQQADQLDELRSRLDELGARLDQAESHVADLTRLVSSHVPRPQGRPEFLAQVNISDALAWRAALSSAHFVEQNMLKAQTFQSRRDHLKHAATLAPEGLVLEFGVGSGESLGWLEMELPDRVIVGFDSFEGLPEAWRTGFGEGAFSDVETRPFERAQLRPGWFTDTVADYLGSVDDPIGLLHVDCDLYASTVTVLEHCMPRLAPGAVIVFDEFLNYPGWELHEAKAWREYLAEHDVDLEYVGYVPSWEQISVIVR